MKALTIRQPWASLIAAGVKTVETRSWRTNYRGRIAIHAGRTKADPRDPAWEPLLDAPGSVLLRADVRPLPLGAVVATAELIDCVPMVDDTAMVDAPYLRVFAGGRLGLRMTDVHIGDVTDQLPFGVFEPGRWAWLLDDVHALPTPVPCSGRQGFWNLPDDIAVEVERCRT